MVDGVRKCLGLYVALLPSPTFYLEPEPARLPFFPFLGPQLGVTPKASADRDIGPENPEASRNNATPTRNAAASD